MVGGCNVEPETRTGEGKVTDGLLLRNREKRHSYLALLTAKDRSSFCSEISSLKSTVVVRLPCLIFTPVVIF